MSGGLLGSQAEWIALWRAAMTSQGLTHREVDDRAELGEGYVSKLLCGQRAPTPRTIERMNRALGIRLRPEVIPCIDALSGVGEHDKAVHVVDHETT